MRGMASIFTPRFPREAGKERKRERERECRSTSLRRNSISLGPYSRPMPRPLWWSKGGGLFLMAEASLYTQCPTLAHSARCSRGSSRTPPTLNLPPSTLNAEPSTLEPQRSTINPQPYMLHPQPSTLNLQRSLLNP